MPNETPTGRKAQEEVLFHVTKQVSIFTFKSTINIVCLGKKVAATNG